ncbi:hypothetical protein [Actinosynnema sp. NPDC023587]|uniref:hypothetical protein n=1 Tax=Actinosynnema sp. NPDC023587 TaxID=3154695 RepID=UPI0033E0B792
MVEAPSVAWANSHQSPYEYVSSDFVSDHRRDLDTAAADLIEPLLRQVWMGLGYEVEIGTAEDVETSPMDTATYHSVWDQAAALLDPDLLVDHAGLADIRRTYS